MGSCLGACALVVWFLAACQSQPQGTRDSVSQLTDYISKSFAIKSVRDRKNLLEFLTGNARMRLEAWSEEQFSKAFVETHREFLKLDLKEVKNLSPTETTLTYEVSFRQGKPGAETIVTNKKLCYMVKDSTAWRIRDVRNLKELVVFQNEMTLP